MLLLCLGILYRSLGMGTFGGTALEMAQAPVGQTPPKAELARAEDDRGTRKLPAELGRLLPGLVLQELEPGRFIRAECGRLLLPCEELELSSPLVSVEIRC